MFTYKYFLLIFLILIFLLHFYTPTYTYPTSPSLPYYTIFQVYCPLILSHPIDFDKHIFDTIDDIVLGDIVNNDSILLSEFFFIGRSIISTIMCTTPNCLRINIENRKKKH